MNKHVIKINNKEVFSFILTLLSVWMSRTVFFGIVNYATTQIIYFGCIFVALFFLRSKIIRIKKALIMTAVPVALFLLNILFHFSEMNPSNFNAVFGYIIMLLCGAMITVWVTPKLFSKYYIYILLGYCIISLPCIVIANVDENLAFMLCQDGYKWDVPYGYFPLYTWGINGTISLRNSGPFWEPGGFQAYIWIAIMLLLFDVDKHSIKRRKSVFIIFLITLLTTKSTTGYILLIFAFFLFNGRILQLFGIKEMRRRVFFTIIIVLIGLTFLNMQAEIIEKLVNKNNISTQMRSDDVWVGGLLAVKAGPLGLGETTARNILRLSMGLYKDDSAGLIQITYTFGWFMGIYYLWALCGISKHLFNANIWRERIGISIVMIILHMTEGLWSLPFFWILIFAHDERNKA